MNICKIEGCEKRVAGRGYCSAHYSKVLKYGNALAGTTHNGGNCKAKDCNNKVHAFGLCRLHYERFKKHGDTSVIKLERLCSVEGCNEKHKANGFCVFHNDRNRRFGDPLGGNKRHLKPGTNTVCSVEGCETKAAALTLCPKHWRRLKKHGSVNGGVVQDGRSKEWSVNKIGYISKWDRSNPNGNKITGIVFQHRDIMSNIIGRPLTSNENVHHKNGDRSDNRPENLELWVKSQPAGQRVKDLLSWAREIISTYEVIEDKL